MPLNKGCSTRALEQNISAEIRAGRPRSQAIAIAYSTLKESCKKMNKPVPQGKSMKKPHSKTFLESALEKAKKLLNPRDYAVIFQATRAGAGGKISAGEKRKELRDLKKTIDFVGPDNSKLIFVSLKPSPVEFARGSAIVGDDAITFNNVYLKNLDLEKSDVAIGFIVPEYINEDLTDEKLNEFAGKISKSIKKYKGAKLVALGKSAKDVLRKFNIDCLYLPHPSAVRKKGDSGEVSRKLKSIKKALDEKYSNMQNDKSKANDSSQENAPKNSSNSEIKKCKIIKSVSEKQIIYGVVLDPYQVDLQNDWIPPNEIESTAHDYLKKSRVIGFEHIEQADAQIVESWLEPYPSPEDYRAAMVGKPHKAYKRQFGNDIIHSGAWIAGVHVGEKEWELHKEGKLNAFSVGGFTMKSDADVEDMPKVDFINLKPEEQK